MSNISSLTSKATGTSNAYSSNGMSGLVSGMDTDSMIENMTAATRSKIAKQLQSKTLLSWKTDAYRSISTPLIAFSNKYMSYSSNTNLFSSSFFSQNSITTSGVNNKYVSVSGSSSSANTMTIDGVKQLATDASFVTINAASTQQLETGAISLGLEDTSSLSGKSFNVKYGADNYTVSIPDKETDTGIYTPTELADAITNSMKKITLSSGKNPDGTKKTLADVANVNMTDGKLVFNSLAGETNTIKISGGSDATLLSNLGLTDLVDKSFTTSGISGTEITADNLKRETTMKDRWLNKSISFGYNGTTKAITFTKDDLKFETDGSLTPPATLDTLKEKLQEKLNDTFGTGRITVGTNTTTNGFSFSTTLPDGVADPSSVLKITGGSGGLFGTSGALHIRAGSSNRLNLNAPLKDSGLANLSSPTTFGITINGETITGETVDGVVKAFDANTTISDIMRVVNSNSKAGVKISYSESNDKFTVASTQKGASGELTIGGTADDLGALLFGTAANRTTTLGQDAIVVIDYDGAGGQAPVDVVRGSNSFTLDGLNISVNGTFGYTKETGDNPDTLEIESEYFKKTAGTESVKMTAQPQTDKIIEAVKQMAEDYNKMVDLVNTSVKEKRDRNYAPLTDAQKKDMTADQIKTWEEKAKKGILFGDTDLFSLSNDLRFVFSSTRSDGLKFSDIGLTVSSSYNENGKVTIDETKLKAALESRPNDVQKLFSNSSDDTSSNNGVMGKLKSITDQYASTTGATKGVFVEKAGNEKAPTSVLKNILQTKMDDIDKLVKTLNSKLKSEQTRYQKQFTALEQLVSKMNAQSSYFTNL